MIDHALALTHIDERGAARMVDVRETRDFEGCQSVRARDHEAVYLEDDFRRCRC